jgi:hypothetical protein
VLIICLKEETAWEIMRAVDAKNRRYHFTN